MASTVVVAHKWCRGNAIRRLRGAATCSRALWSWPCLFGRRYMSTEEPEIGIRPKLEAQGATHVGSFRRPLDGKRLLSPIVIDRDATVYEKEIQWKDLKKKSQLPMRDLLRLEEKHDIPQFHILPRSNCVILCLSDFRALLFANEVMIFNTKGKHVVGLTTKLRHEIEAYRKHLQATYHEDKKHIADKIDADKRDQVLKERMEEIRTEVPFEFAVLDFCLREIISMYSNRVMILQPLVENAIRSNDVDSRHSEASQRLIALFPLRTSLQHLVGISENIERGLWNVLNDEQQLREACLTEKQNLNGILNFNEVSQTTILSLESMLESHHQKVTVTNQSADQLSRKISLKQETINLQMDAYRNYVMSRSLEIQIASVGIALGSFVVASFGMNLASGLENFSHAMWLVTASSALLATSVTGLYLRKVRKLSPVNSQREGRGNLWEVLDAGTSTVLYTSDSTVSEDRFRKLCKDVTGREPSSKEMKMIFDTFDVSGDGKLDIEVLPAIINTISKLLPHLVHYSLKLQEALGISHHSTSTQHRKDPIVDSSLYSEYIETENEQPTKGK